MSTDQTATPGRTATMPSVLSPCTGWERRDWADLADRMLRAVRPYASRGHAQIVLPAPSSRRTAAAHGTAVAGLEGFARTFLIAGFRLAGEHGADPDGLAEWYVRGLAAGTDPAAPDRWIRLDEHPQAKVEAASIALVLDLTRPWIWDRLDQGVQQRIVDYLTPAVGDQTYPRINWVWFRLVVQTFLRSVGGPWSQQDMLDDLASNDGFARADGWLADGAERSFDHYAGWALHLYPTLWARMSGAADLAADRRARDLSRLDRYLSDAVALLGADGSPLLQGRSLAYRFAAAAPFWVGAIAQVPSVPPGLLRRAASGVVRHFVDHGAPDERGLLTLGWHHEWPQLAQAYSGPGSPYWASKGLLGLTLPADHPVWTATEEPLPVERADTLRSVRAPGWIVAGTVADGLVRVVNHGTDHAVEGALTGDSPLYARLGYSTATSPLLDDASWLAPADQAVTLVDPDGRATHRTGLRTVAVEVRHDGGTPVGLGVSRCRAHWLRADADQQHHGSGYVGQPTIAAEMTVASLVRGPWELRLVRVEDLAPGLDPDGLRLRISGWAVSGPQITTVPVRGGAGARAGRTSSTITPALGATRPGLERRSDASPLGPASAVPWLELPVRIGTWSAALVEVTAVERSTGSRGCTAAVSSHARQTTVTATWPDQVRTSTTFTSSGDADPSTR